MVPSTSFTQPNLPWSKMTKPERKISFECWSITSSKTSMTSKYSPQFSPSSPRTIQVLKIVQKTIFAITLGTLILLLLIQTGRCVWRYLEVPTYFASRVLPQSEADFPAITICPDGDDGYKEPLLQVDINSGKTQNSLFNLFIPSLGPWDPKCKTL